MRKSQWSGGTEGDREVGKEGGERYQCGVEREAGDLQAGDWEGRKENQQIEVGLLFIRKGTRLLSQKEKNFFIDSKVLTMRNSVSKDIKFISDSLCRPSALNLLFRASEHSFSEKTFHKLCDKTLDTFVLVRTEFGKTLGGYSHYSWEEKE